MRALHVVYQRHGRGEGGATVRAYLACLAALVDLAVCNQVVQAGEGCAAQRAHLVLASSS